MLLIPFHSGRNGRNFSCRYANRYRKPPRSTSGQISGCFRQFRPILAGMEISAGTGFWVKKKKKNSNVQTTPFWTWLKDLTHTLFLSFFHSQIPHSLPSFSSHCRRARAHCRCSALSITRLSHTHLSLTLSQSHSLGLNSQGILSLLSLSRIQASVQPNHFFFLMICFVVKI